MSQNVLCNPTATRQSADPRPSENASSLISTFYPAYRRAANAAAEVHHAKYIARASLIALWPDRADRPAIGGTVFIKPSVFSVSEARTYPRQHSVCLSGISAYEIGLGELR
jgi:hypothetical protein